jgi:hypothetical protein
MKLFTIKIVSATYNLHSYAQLLSNDEAQAKEMVGTRFHESVTAFLAPLKDIDRSARPTIPKEDLLRAAKYSYLHRQSNHYQLRMGQNQMTNNAVTEPTEELKLTLPWELTCNLACKAMIRGTTFDAAIQKGLADGLERVASRDEALKSMRRANRASK